jgi:hypothetical protein
MSGFFFYFDKTSLKPQVILPKLNVLKGVLIPINSLISSFYSIKGEMLGTIKLSIANQPIYQTDKEKENRHHE